MAAAAAKRGIGVIMKCHCVQKHLDAYVHQECDASLRDRIKAHIQTCETCADVMEGYQRLRSLSKQIPLSAISEQELEQLERDTLQRIRDLRQSHHPGRQIFTRLGWAALVLIITGVAVWRSHQTESPLDLLLKQDTIHLHQIKQLAVLFQNPEQLERIIDQPISVHSLITSLRQLENRTGHHGQVNKQFSRLIDQLDKNAGKDIPKPGNAHLPKLNPNENEITQMLALLRKVQRQSRTITLRHIVSVYRNINS